MPCFGQSTLLLQISALLSDVGGHGPHVQHAAPAGQADAEADADDSIFSTDDSSAVLYVSAEESVEQVRT